MGTIIDHASGSGKEVQVHARPAPSSPTDGAPRGLAPSIGLPPEAPPVGPWAGAPGTAYYDAARAICGEVGPVDHKLFLDAAIICTGSRVPSAARTRARWVLMQFASGVTGTLPYGTARHAPWFTVREMVARIAERADDSAYRGDESYGWPEAHRSPADCAALAAILALDAWSLRAAALTIHSLTDDAHWVVTANAANAAAMSAMGCAKQHAKDAATAARDGRDLGGISRDLHRELAARLTMARAPSSAWSADLAGVWLSGTDVPRTLRDHQAFSELADAPLAPAVQDDGAPTDAP